MFIEFITRFNTLLQNCLTLRFKLQNVILIIFIRHLVKLETDP